MRFFAALLSLCACLAQAQDYPVKTVRIVAPAAPGGNPDILGRMLAARLAEGVGEAGGQHPRQHIGVAARGGGGDQAHVLGRIFLRLG